MTGQLRGVTGPLTKLVVFAVVTILCSYVLVSTITNAGYGEQLEYKAEFTDVTGLVEGDEVRIAGVRVGQVTGIEISERTEGSRGRPVAEVALEVSADVPLPRAVEATIRFRNLVGQRYIALVEGEGSGGQMLAAGATIPLAQTREALDLTTLFGGFRPLLQALSPGDVNRVSFEIIQVFQGEAGTMESLLRRVGSLTNSLADKDAVIGSVIDNLTTVMSTVAERDRQLDGLIVSLQEFVTGLASDKEAIFDSLQTIDELAATTSGFLEDVRAPLAADIEALGDLSQNVADDGAKLETFLQRSPFKIDQITRTAINGSWFNFYLCEYSGTVTFAEGTPFTDSSDEPGVQVAVPRTRSGEGCG